MELPSTSGTREVVLQAHVATSVVDIWPEVDLELGQRAFFILEGGPWFVRMHEAP